MGQRRRSSRFLFWRRHASNDEAIEKPPPGIAISVRNLRKTFNTAWWKWDKQNVTAIEDLSMDIPKGGIFVLLGSNGLVHLLFEMGRD